MEQDVFILEGINIGPLLSAIASFEDMLARPDDEANKDSTILRFNLVFELTWKTLKRILDYKGIEVANPRDTFRYAAQAGIIEDPRVWFGFLLDRNKITHIYNRLMADEIYYDMPKFKAEINKLIQTIKAL